MATSNRSINRTAKTVLIEALDEKEALLIERALRDQETQVLLIVLGGMKLIPERARRSALQFLYDLTGEG